jgi:hypothetical protein
MTRRTALLAYLSRPGDVVVACQAIAHDERAARDRVSGRERQRRLRARRAAAQAAKVRDPGPDPADTRPILSLEPDQAGTLNN